MYVFSNLDERKVEAVRHLESERGVRLLAFSELTVQPVSGVDPDTLEAIRRLEREIGVTLIAVS